MQKLSQFSNLNQLPKIVAQSPTIFCNVSPVLVILIIKTLISPHGVIPHFFWPLEVWLNLYLLKNLVHKLFEYCANHLSSRKASMSKKVSSRSVVIVPLKPKVSSIRGNYFGLSLALLLIVVDPFVFINLIHELTHILRWFLRQGLP